MTDDEILRYPQQAYYSQEYREQWLAERVRRWVAAINAWQRQIYSDAVDAEIVG
jgi:hypothetical protein